MASNAPASFSDQPGNGEWISLYHGREATFQAALIQQIRDICASYGIPYQINEDRLILVPKGSRASILTLIAGHYKK